MESLNDILKRIAVKGSSSARSRDSEPAAGAEEVEHCPVCDDARWINVDAPVGSSEFGTVRPCDCQRRVWGADSSTRLRDYSDLGPLERMTFESLEPAGRDGFVDAPSFRRARDAAQTYSHEPLGWLVIIGPSGTGKTHLAAAVANRVLEGSRPVKFVSVPDLLDRMRSAISTGSDDANGGDLNDLFEHITQAPMLVLDDLGAQSQTRWAEDKVDQVLSFRYSRRLPTVITSSTPVDQFTDRIRTRLTDPFIAERLELLPGLGNADRSSVGLSSTELNSMTFESFDPRGARGATRRHRETVEPALAHARSFAEMPQGWIYLAGSTGVGKTHLAVAIANVQIQQGRSVLFRFVPDLLDQLRRAYHPGSPAGFDREFQVIRNCEVLILDDLGAQASTAWAEEKLYQLIAHRHAARLPTVITSRVLLDAPPAAHFTSRYADAIASRLHDTHVVWDYTIDAPDYRHRGAMKAVSSPGRSPGTDHADPGYSQPKQQDARPGAP